jgi:hypothetical protein
MAKTGKNYTTQTGLPVKVIAINSNNMLIQSLATDNRFYVPLNYPLFPLNRRNPVSELKDKPYIFPSEKIKPKNLNKKPLSAVIDELLLSGKKYTMKGLIREVKRRASSQCKGKDVAANIYFFVALAKKN